MNENLKSHFLSLYFKGNFRQITFRGHYKIQASKHLFCNK